MPSVSSCIRVMLVDPHPAIREALKLRVLSEADIEVCAESCNAMEALLLIEQLRPDIVILELALKGGDGLELARRLHQHRSPANLIFYSRYDEKTYAERCLKAGAMGYINKQADSQEVVRAIREVMAGNIYVSRAPFSSMNSRSTACETNDALASLTDRQLEIFRLIGEGKGTSEIAHQLHLSIHTVETHRENMKRKLGLSSSSALIRSAVLWTANRPEFCDHPQRREI